MSGHFRTSMTHRRHAEPESLPEYPKVRASAASIDGAHTTAASPRQPVGEVHPAAASVFGNLEHSEPRPQRIRPEPNRPSAVASGGI